MRQLPRLVDLPQRRLLACNFQHREVQFHPGGLDGLAGHGHGAGAQPQNFGTGVLAWGVFLPGLAVTRGGGIDLEMVVAKPRRVQCGLGGAGDVARAVVDRIGLGFFLDRVCVDLGAHGFLHPDFVG